MKLLKWQEAAIEMINDVPADADSIIKIIGLNEYIKQYRTFEYKLPRGVGKSFLIVEVAKRTENPIIITATLSQRNDYPEEVRQYVNVKPQYGKRIGGILCDENKNWVYPDYMATDKNFFVLKVGTL